MMTFGEFQATGCDCDDLVAKFGDVCWAQDEKPHGRVYVDSLWIAERPVAGWPNGRPERWSLLIGRDDWLTDDLALVERKLYEFACDEGYCG
jgi:hypothetical protein